MNIAGVEVGPGHLCRVIAEVSNNHNGSLDRALRLISAAKEAGADFVKFQCYTPDELVKLRGDGPAPDPWGSDGWTMHDLYEKAQNPHSWFPALAEHAREVGIPWFSSVFGADSLRLLESLGCPAYKVSAFEAGKGDFLNAVRATGKPVIRSDRVDITQERSNVLSLFCPQGYPQEDARLSVLRRWGSGYHGYSYHGTNPFIPVAAVLCGAKIVEVHFHLTDEPSELEPQVSLDADDLYMMIAEMRFMEMLL